MGIEELFPLAKVKDEKEYSTSMADLWNRYVPNAIRVGDTTNINGRRESHSQKNFNNLPVDELEKRMADTSKETNYEGDPYFYKLRNVDTGETKVGLAPKGLDDRYRGQDLSQWEVLYNKRRSDAVDLEATIHGNETLLKNRAVGYGLSSNKFGKGATEIYNQIVTEQIQQAHDMLDLDQTSLFTKVIEGGKIASGYYDEKGQDTSEGRSDRMIKTLRDIPLDFGKGMGIGIAKGVGGVASLLGGDRLKQEMQDVATTSAKGISSKHNVASTFGEITPELLLPASVPVKAGIGLVKGIGIGATSGAVINAGYEGIKSQSGIKEGEEPSPMIAGGIGAIIGGFIGGVQGKTIAKAFDEGDDTVKAQIVESLAPEQKQYLKEYVSKQQSEQPKLQQENDVIKADLVKPEVKEVKPEQVASRVSKSGEKVTDAQGMEKLSKVEYEVVKPTEEAIDVVTKRPLRQDYKTEDRQARAYTEEGSLLSPQGDISQKTALKIKEQKPIVNAEEHVNEKLKVFDDEQELKKAYGQKQTRLKDENIKETSTAQVKANRLAYEKSLYNEIRKDKSLPQEVIQNAKTKLAELSSKKVLEIVHTEQAIESATMKAEAQIGKTKEDTITKEDRQAEDNRIYEEFKARDKEYQKGYGFAQRSMPDKEVYKNILDDAISRKSEVAQAKERIDKRESLGNKPNPNDEYIVRHQAELRSDIESFKDKKIDIDELRFREMRRLDDRLKKNEEMTFENKDAIRISEEERVRQYKRLDVNAKEREFKAKKQTNKDYEYTYDKAKDNSRTYTESIANKYVKDGQVDRKATGELTLRKDQVELLDRGITPEQLGRLASGDREIKKLVKEEVAKILNKKERNTIGVREHADIKKQYVFKDEMTDASNSAYQFISVLTGDKSLAQGTKLTANGKDFREEIAKDMKLKPELKTKIESNTKEEFGKSHIKPLAMVWAYGSTDKSLIRTFAKDNKLSLNEAEEVFKEFNRVFLDKYPSAKMLRDNIYNLQERNKGTFTWTLPNGTKSSFTAKGSVKGTIGKSKAEITTDSSDMNSRALMPNIIHSIDGYAIQEVAKRLNIPIATVHDAVRTTKGESNKVLKAYTEVMQEINDSNLLDDIMKELGYKGEPLKRHFGQLTKEDIAGGDKKMSIEHSEGEKIDVSKKEIDDSRIKEPEELMKDFMAGQDVRKTEANLMLDRMVQEQTFSKIFNKPSESPFENVMYWAMQGNKFTDKMMVKTPEGVDTKMYKSVQQKLFEEARKKLEYNPLIRNDGEIKGMRKYFDENGKPIGQNRQTVNEILRAERKMAESQGIKNYDKIASEVRSFKPDVTLTMSQIKKKQLVDQIVMDTLKQSKASGYKTLWKEQTSENHEYKEFNNLERIKKVFKEEVDRDAEILYENITKMTPETKAHISKLINSDYEAIRGMTKKQGELIQKNQYPLLQVTGKEITASAKGLSSASNMYGYHLNNAHLIAERYNLPKSDEKIIDQLISIEAMNMNKGWDALEDLGKDNLDAKYVLDAMTRKRLLSEDLFANNPEKIIKGWKPEVYRGKRELTPDGKSTQWNASSVYEEGIIGSDLQQNKIGELFEDTVPVFKDLKTELDWMQKNRLRKTNGEYRKVADEKIRTELGKTDKLEEIVTEALRSTQAKIKQQGLIAKIMVDTDRGDSLLFSKVPKEGFSELTKEQLYTIPFELRSETKFMNTEFLTKLIGRKEVRLYNGTVQSLKVLDRLASNMGTAFKQNVVLKNPVSYLNSFLVNQTLGMTIGANTITHALHQKRAMSLLKEMNDIIKELHSQKIAGGKIDKELSDKLGANELYQMERLGLSTNRVEGVVGDDDLLGAMLKKGMNDKIFKLFSHANLNQKTPMGKKALRLFSDIDTMGRYSMAKSLMDKNPKMTMQEAVTKSNGLYSDMDKMVPPMIELLDKYGFVPFLKWFTLTSPNLLKVSKENPVKALAVAVGLYTLGAELGLNLSSVNPLEAVIDFTEMSTPIATIQKVNDMGFLDTMSTRAESNVIPKYIHNVWKSPETLGLNKLMKKRIKSEPYKGFVQSTIEKKD